MQTRVIMSAYLIEEPRNKQLQLEKEEKQAEERRKAIFKQFRAVMLPTPAITNAEAASGANKHSRTQCEILGDEEITAMRQYFSIRTAKASKWWR